MENLTEMIKKHASKGISIVPLYAFMEDAKDMLKDKPKLNHKISQTLYGERLSN